MGKAMTFKCDVQRSSGEPKTAHACTRTGRTRHRRHTFDRGVMLKLDHEYVCACGHTGWSRHRDVLFLPIVTPEPAP